MTCRVWRCGLIVMLLLLVTSITPVSAQKAGAFGAAQKLADAGKHRDAVAAFSGALNSGTLSPADTARGFYLRGVSYAKSGKNPQAISDLTNALWLTGLSDDERANGYRMRAAAYRASGYKAKAAADLKRAAQNPSALTTGLTTTVTAATPKPAVKKVATALSSGDNAWAAQTADAAHTAGAAQTAGAAKTVKTAVPKPKPVSSGNAVSDFFSGFFSAGASPPPVKTATAKAAQPSAGDKPTRSASAGTAVSSWSSSVDTTAKRPPAKSKAKAKQVAAVKWGAPSIATAPAKPRAKPAQKLAPKKKAARKGRFNVQVATVRERAAAEIIRRSLAAKAPKALAGLTPSIDTAVLGNMGTFYRVRVDGLATRQASANLCETLAKSGHDCFLITR